MTFQSFDTQTMPLDGTGLIEASAGTGKTFSLAGLFLRLLIERCLPVQEILVMTFTRAATQELRDRIRQRLSDAARIAHDPDCAAADDAEHQLAEAIIAARVASSDETRDRLARRLSDAARRMDEASITTIHGFAQRAAAENAFDSALPFDRGDAVDERMLHAEVVADYWRKLALGDDAITGFTELWPTPEELSSDLAGFLNRPHARLAGPDSKEIGTLVDEVRALWSRDGEQFSRDWASCVRDGLLLKGKTLDKLILAAGGIDHALSELAIRLEADVAIPCLPAWVRFPEQAKGAFKVRQLDRGQTLLSDPLARALTRLQELAQLETLRTALQATRDMAQARKQQRRQYSYADLIAALHAAITDPSGGARLADALHGAWPWALVDEFQDTDPLQYEILQRIYSGRSRGGLILIGDPKQAIYGFRGGDVHAYLAAARDAGGQRYSLDANFRSTPALLAAVETLFRQPGPDAFLVDGIEFQHVSAGRPVESTLQVRGTDLPAMTLWPLNPDLPNKGDAAAACERACVNRIRELLDADSNALIRQHVADQTSCEPVVPSDIAVLVNANSQASRMQRALSAAGIAAVCLHQNSVYSTHEARELLTLLRAAANPTDEGLLRGALATDLIGYRLTALTELTTDAPSWQAVSERFLQNHQRWRDAGVLAMLQPIIQQGAEHLLSCLDGERRLSNYLQLAELLAGIESQAYGMSGLLNELQRCIVDSGDGEASEAEQLRLESDEGLVRIATIHKAKGLEYPIVFLPYAPWTGAGGKPDCPPLNFHDDDHRALIDVIGLSGNLERSIQESRAEGLRVLYVALTRAKLACFLPWGAANGTADSALASLLHRDCIAPHSWAGAKTAKPLNPTLTENALATLVQAAPQAIGLEALPESRPHRAPSSTESPPQGQARTDLPSPRPAWSVHSFTRLTRSTVTSQATPGAADETSGEPAELTPQARSALPRGAVFGTAVHAVLEATDPADWPAPGQTPAERQLREVATGLRRHGLHVDDETSGQEMILQTADLISRSLHTPLPDIGKLAAVGPGRRLPEMEFLMRLGDQRIETILKLLGDSGYARFATHERGGDSLRGLMHGFIDLVVEADGRYFVLDYKTNWLGPDSVDYRPEALRLAIEHHQYDLQYLIYLTALHRHLRRRLPDYDPGHHLGGALYLFLRGMSPTGGNCGIHFDRPDPELILKLDALLDFPADTPGNGRAEPSR